ncbi:hypothetical protein CKM354_000541800 [Cercospora kikuchii]|uniref:Uncharacterized protein n=1 Tax=Cercospora kikuchii TaxID=84275 RepID=A0A9P3CFW8_9PEZI|nr:uncharacterized protein CKM354_000541800 [Cercospora kikuchii]GIZ42139.1 hypothetical protein CKM354_000541800 [Cercospora kikuchii]
MPYNSNLQSSRGTDTANHEMSDLPFPGISAVVLSATQDGKSLSSNLSSLSLQPQTHSTADTAPIKHPRSAEDARKSIGELFPKPKYFEEPEYFEDEALPRSDYINKKYHANNFATLPRRCSPSGLIDRSQEHFSRSDLVELGQSEARSILPQEHAAKYMLPHENFSIGDKSVNKGYYLFTEADFEDMQAETMQGEANRSNSKERPLPELDLSLSAIEGMTHFGACFVTNGINYPLSSREEKAAVLQIFAEQVSRDKNAVSRAFVSKSKTEMSPAQGIDLLKHKVQRLLSDRVLTICGNTVVPCTEEDEPLVGEQNRYTKRALKEVFKLLSDDNNDWLAEDPIEQQMDPFRWTRTITTIETKAGSRDKVTIALKRRSQMRPTKSEDIFGFGLTFAESYSEIRRETKVSVACKEAISQLRARKAQENAVADAKELVPPTNVLTQPTDLHPAEGIQKHGSENTMGLSSTPEPGQNAEMKDEKRKRRRPAESFAQPVRLTLKGPRRKTPNALQPLKSKASQHLDVPPNDGIVSQGGPAESSDANSTSNPLFDGDNFMHESSSGSLPTSKPVILRLGKSAISKFAEIIDRLNPNKRQKVEKSSRNAEGAEIHAAAETSTSQTASSGSMPSQNKPRPKPDKGKGRKTARK